MWLIVMAAFVIIEGATNGLYTIWFAVGATLAAICAAIGLHLYVQSSVFLFVSLVLLLSLRPVARKYLSTRKSATNADRVLEKTGIVTEDIDNTHGSGAVYIDGKTWTARSYDGTLIKKDTHVSAKMIEGVKLIVYPISNEQLTATPL